MATLEKIRSKGVVLVVVVALALFAFIIGDFLTQGSSFFNKSREVVASVEGEDININEFQNLIAQVEIVQKIESGVNEIDEQTMDQIRAYVWETLVSEKLLRSEAVKMGLTVTPEELSDRLIGNNIHPIVAQRRIFADESGRFNKSILINFLSQINSTPEGEQANQQFEDLKKYWMFWERSIKFSILQEKYNLLMGNAVVPNKIDAEFNFNARNTMYDVNYVVKPYFTIADSLVSVSEKEIKDLYNKKIQLFKQEPNVDMKYVAIDVRPQPEDYKEAEKWINDLSAEFKTTEDIKALVNSNSDIPYTGKNYTVNTVPFTLKDFAFGGSTGDIYGPVFANDAYTMARIMQSGIASADSVKIRHIFLTAEAASKTDSIVNLINSGADFAALAKEFSAVQQTAANGGEIGWITENSQGLDEETITKSFSSSINQVFTIKSAQGTQILQVTDKTKPVQKVKLAILERKVFASSASISKLFNEAKRFATELKADSFDTRAQAFNYIVRNADNTVKTSPNIHNIKNSRQVIRWAFENGVNKVSDVFECDNKFIIALTTSINDADYRSVEKVSEQLKAELIRDKKAEIMVKELSGKGNTLEAIATSTGLEIKNATAVNFGSYQFGAAGFEPNVLGLLTKQALNSVSAPIKGISGVYVIQTIASQKGTEVYNANSEKQSLIARYSYSLPMSIINDLKDKAEIKDNRINFY